MTGWDHQRTAD